MELQLHAAVTWFLAGLIWVIQLVHYPMLQFLDRAGFQRGHAFHTTAISFLVGPAMLLELAIAVWIAWRRGPSQWPSSAGLALVALIWGVTFLVMVPLHERLQNGGFEQDTHAALCRWNWVRTAAWTARGLIALVWL